MPIQNNFSFTPLTGLRDVTVYPEVPPSEEALRDAIQQGPDQLQDFINNILIPNIFAISDIFNDLVVSGLLPTTSANLTTTTPAGVAYVTGLRLKTQDGVHSYPASSDVYVDLNGSGALSYTAVANGASAPALAANSIRLAKVVTSTTAITSVVDLRSTKPKISGNIISLVASGGQKIQSGSTIAVANPAAATVTFPTAFSSAPIVLVNAVYSNYLQVSIVSATSTQFQFISSNTASISYNWVAIGS